MTYKHLPASEKVKIKRLDVKAREAELSIKRRNVQSELTGLKNEIKHISIQINDIQQPFYLSIESIPQLAVIQISQLNDEKALLENEREAVTYSLTEIANDQDQCKIDHIRIDKEEISIRNYLKRQRKLQRAVGDD